MKICSILIVCLAASTAIGEGFDLTWHSIDGGGVMRSTGGDFELSGTIGQPDAGAMVGGSFQLTGGFWFEISPGDCDEDGVVNLMDHEFFTHCLAGPEGGVLSDCECFDVDRNGNIDLHDFAVISQEFASR
ncbi:MAG: hypothetical protein HYR83_13275 [Planctomycetes bacterium]|nr:hypothetical protein [Planctomycetota bacterium]